VLKEWVLWGMEWVAGLYGKFHFIHAGSWWWQIKNPHSSPCPPPEGDKGGGWEL